MNQTNLIERYVAEVGRMLPAHQRADVQQELHSALLDAAEARGLDPDKKSDTAAVAELLREFGPPIEVAKGYGLRTFLIGPELQPMYRLVLRINAIAAAVVSLGRLVLAANASGQLGAALGSAVGGFVNQLLFSFAIVTIIFGLLDYFLPEVKTQVPLMEWDPNKLPEAAPDQDDISWFEVVVELIFGAGFISVAATLSSWALPQPIAEFVAPLLPFMPWIVGLAVAQMLVRVTLLVQGRWTNWLRWADLVIALGWVLQIGAVFRLAPFPAAPVLNVAFQVGVGVSFVIALIDFAVKLWRQSRPGRLSWQ